MKAAAVFVAFFLLFTLATLAVPVSMFPGNMIETWVDVPYISVVANGVTYGFITWVVFFFISRRIEKSLSANQ